MHEEFAPDFLSEEFLFSKDPEEDEEGDFDTEDEEEEAPDLGDTEDEEL